MSTTTTRLARRAATATAAVLTALTLAACGGNGDNGDNGNGGSSDANADTDAHNAADVTFAQAMIPHHQQAIEMAELALDQASSEDVQALAEEISAAQAPEIATLTEWLEAWGEEVPAGNTEDHAGHAGHDMPAMNGMLSADQMAELADASGTDFDTAFLELMIEHHEGAVEMARDEQADGSYEPATSMAEDIVTTQSAEIERMNELLPTAR
ncbi:DUF305 domain-containing protein [Streptomyces sp. URMC 129]|uniref:DUF305 domain-containing protein n=1 Tax=Streptomyces sp. URMC 129 TaxID=3423407 RepID=UPI003F1A783A